jgi:DNA-3-methyladenine glycosylase II
VRWLERPVAPYSLALTASRFTRWPEAVDRFDGKTYRRLLPIGRRGVLVEVRQLGPPTRPILKAALYGEESRSAPAREAGDRVLRLLLGAGLDVRPFYRAFRDDPLLGEPLRRFRGLRIAGSGSLWEALVTAVLSQQVNLVFAYDMRRELSLAFGRRARFGAETFIGFPAPHRIAAQTLRRIRSFRLSEAKAATVLRLAEGFTA